jgi:DNA-binding response OmpR family regulator
MQSVKRRILCIEEDEDSCDIVTIWLSRAGYEVVLARTATEGLNKTLLGGFDVLLIDPYLPDGSGLELCQQIRGFNSQTPICFYTTDTFPKQIEAAMMAGANAYLVKPVLPDEMERTIEQLLQ